MVDQGSSRRIFKQVKRSGLLTDLSHVLHACGNVLMHIDMFSGKYTSLGTGDILVRMCGSWRKSWLISAGRVAFSSKSERNPNLGVYSAKFLS